MGSTSMPTVWKFRSTVDSSVAAPPDGLMAYRPLSRLLMPRNRPFCGSQVRPWAPQSTPVGPRGVSSAVSTSTDTSWPPLRLTAYRALRSRVANPQIEAPSGNGATSCTSPLQGSTCHSRLPDDV
jgi:hypothetical protein